MKRKHVITLFTFLFMGVVVTPVMAAPDEKVEELEQNLRERDKVILELLERVEYLEQRIGVRRPADRAPETMPEESAETSGSEPGRGMVEVEEGEEERALDRALVREGALLLPRGVMDIETRIAYARREESSPVLFSSGDEIFAGEAERNTDDMTVDIGLRLGLIRDSQLEIGLPYRWREIETVNSIDSVALDSSSRSGSGSGDLRIGLAKTLLREKPGRPDIILRFRWDTHTGETKDLDVVLNGRYDELQGSLTAIKRQDPLVFVGTLAYEHVFERDAVRPGSSVTTDIGGQIALSPSTSMSLRFIVSRLNEIEVNGNEIAGSDQTLATFALGGSSLLARGTLIGLSGGIGLTEDSDAFSISLSLTKRFNQPLF